MLRNVTSQPSPDRTSKLAARRARIAGLRKRFIAVSTAVFVAVWIAIFAQLVSGHDPALAAHSTSGQVASSSSSSGAASTGGSSASAGNSGSATASPVTTHQS
jgi:hypothetical protein